MDGNSSKVERSFVDLNKKGGCHFYGKSHKAHKRGEEAAGRMRRREASDKKNSCSVNKRHQNDFKGTVSILVYLGQTPT